MVDFKKLHDEWYAGLDDEARARVDAAAAREARFEATAVDVEAVFEREEYARAAPAPAARPLAGMAFGPRRPMVAQRPPARKPDPAEARRVVVAEKRTETIRMRIEDRTDGGEILRFIGGPTGHEAYRLDADFCAMVADPEEKRARPRWYICAGTPGRWEACSVAHEAVESYLRERRPELFPDHAPSPGMR